MNILLEDSITSRVYKLYGTICKEYTYPLEHWLAFRLCEIARHKIIYRVPIEKNQLIECLGVLDRRMALDIVSGLNALCKEIRDDFGLEKKC